MLGLIPALSSTKTLSDPDHLIRFGLRHSSDIDIFGFPVHQILTIWVSWLSWYRRLWFSFTVQCFCFPVTTDTDPNYLCLMTRTKDSTIVLHVAALIWYLFCPIKVLWTFTGVRVAQRFLQLLWKCCRKWCNWSEMDSSVKYQQLSAGVNNPTKLRTVFPVAGTWRKYWPFYLQYSWSAVCHSYVLYYQTH